MATIKDLQNVSLRGIVGYGICCLENAMEHYGIDGECWRKFLSAIWKITECSDISDKKSPIWNACYQQFVFIMPWRDYFNIKPVQDAYNAYSRLPIFNASNPSMDLPSFTQFYTEFSSASDVICDLGYNFYRGINGMMSAKFPRLKPSYLLECMERMLDIMMENGIAIPSMQPFLKYPLQSPYYSAKDDIFGQPFDGLQYSKFVNC